MLFAKKKWKSSAVLIAFCLALFCGCTPVNEIQNLPDSNKKISPNDFVYDYLSEDEKVIYDDILSAVNNFEESVYFGELPNGVDLEEIFSLIYTQESEIFWLESHFIPSLDKDGIELIYRFEMEEALERRAEIELTTGNILAEYYSSYNKYDALKHFHDEIVKNCNFSKTGDFVSSAYGALVGGEAKCEGYAFAFSYLCDEIDLPNYVVTGEDKDGNSHAWNRVKLYDSWYNVDLTWDDPILKTENPNYLRHNFFLVTDEEIIGKTHFPSENIVNDISCNSSEMNFFKAENLLFENSEQVFLALPDIIKKTATSKDGKTAELEFRLLDDLQFSETMRILTETNSLTSTIEELNSNFGLKIKSADKNFDENLRVVHISLYF